jgi:hypothetical protein
MDISKLDHHLKLKELLYFYFYIKLFSVLTKQITQEKEKEQEQEEENEEAEGKESRNLLLDRKEKDMIKKG